MSPIKAVRLSTTQLRPRCFGFAFDFPLPSAPDLDIQCPVTAQYKIDGRPLCAYHAGAVALSILLEE